jgi:hyperosmotically inducible periplasmic protein
MGRGAFNTLVVVFVVLAFVAGFQSVTGRSAAANVDDAGITASVKTKIVADKAANLTRIDVDTIRGTVYLNGLVDSAQQRARAERLAKQISGVKSVVNNLQVTQKR